MQSHPIKEININLNKRLKIPHENPNNPATIQNQKTGLFWLKNYYNKPNNAFNDTFGNQIMQKNLKKEEFQMPPNKQGLRFTFSLPNENERNKTECPRIFEEKITKRSEEELVTKKDLFAFEGRLYEKLNEKLNEKFGEIFNVMASGFDWIINYYINQSKDKNKVDDKKKDTKEDKKYSDSSNGEVSSGSNDLLDEINPSLKFSSKNKSNINYF